MPGIGLAGGYGAGGVKDALLEIVKQRMLEQELAQRAEQQQYDRMRQSRAETRAEEQTTYQRGRDTAADARLAQNDAQADAAKRLALMQGQPLMDLATPDSLRIQATPGLPRMLGGRGAQLPPVTGDVPMVDIPGIGSRRPQTREQLDAIERQKLDEASQRTIMEREASRVPKAPADLGSFEDYVLRAYGSNPTPAQIEAGRKAYNQADDVARQPSTGPLVQIQGPNGETIWATREEALHQPAMRPVTQGERQTVAYYNRAKDANETAAQLDPVIAKMGLVAQGRLQYAPNWAQSAENQAYRQAQRAFTEARLRKESGAAINPTEYENDAKTYFAQPGDAPETIALKVKKREVLLRGLAFAAGKAYEEYYGEPAPRGGSGTGGATSGDVIDAATFMAGRKKGGG
jgi:hypothetical protein